MKRGGRVKSKNLALVILIVILCLVPLITQDNYYLGIMITIAVNIIYVSSYRFVLRTGQFSMGHHAFIGIGAYTSALLAMRLGMSFWLAILLAGIVAAIGAVVLGYPSLRVKGLYFGIITWGFAEALEAMYKRWPTMFGGHQGIPGIPRPEIVLPFLPPIKFTSPVPYYYLAMVLMAITLLVLYRLEKSRFGLIFNGIREADLLAKSVGVNIIRYKVLAFAIGAFFAGIGGSFYTHYIAYVSPSMFTILLLIFLYIYVQVGGMHSFAGPIAGVVVLVIVGELLVNYPFVKMLLYSVLLIVVTLVSPGGIVGLIQSASVMLGRSRRGVSRAAPA